MGSEIGKPLPKEYYDIQQGAPGDTSCIINNNAMADQKARDVDEEKVLGNSNNNNDRRSKWNGNNYNISHKCIGQMTMEFNGKGYVGTGTLISCNNKTRTGHVLTCAHNVYDTKSKKYATKLWFTLKNKDNKLLVRFEINNYYVYPSYFNNPGPSQGEDIAICTFSYNNMKDKILKYQHQYFGYDCIETVLYTTDWRTDFFDYISVVGYPGEKKGDLWGQQVNCQKGKKMNKSDIECSDKLIKYSVIDTSGGQSGSPILFGIGDWGDCTAKVIIGVHTGGCELYNCGTRITKETVKWIAKVTKQTYYESAGICTQKEYHKGSTKV